MIQLALFDMGDTLVHEGRPFPGAALALQAIAGFKTADDAPLVLGIVSDYYPAAPPTETGILAREQQYRDEVLEPSGLARFFAPFDERVTLSSRAGVAKPHRRIFDLALERSGSGASLHECLFVTENASHLAACAALGIAPVQFGADFTDWIDAPAVLAALVGPANRARAIAPVLAARHGLTAFKPTRSDGDRVEGQANRLVQLRAAKLGAADGVFVELPAQVVARVRPDGRVVSVDAGPPGQEEVGDAVDFVAGLVKSNRLALPGHPAPPGTTHSLEEDAAGRLRLVRRAYSATRQQRQA